MKIENYQKLIDETLRSDRIDLAKKIEIVAIVTDAMKAINITPVIVGGQAVEFYTAGGYATMDIDMLCGGSSIKEIDSILSPLGFNKEGKYWLLEKNINMAIEVPSGYLAGDWNKVIKVKTKNNMVANFIGIEDIIIDRLNSYKHWNDYSVEEWIIGMIILNYDEIDWDYTYMKAKEEQVFEELIMLKEKAEKDLKDRML